MNSWNVQELLEYAVHSELKNSSGVINPISYDSIRYPEIYAAIRDAMKYQRTLKDSRYVSIKEADIISISDAKILEKIEIFARPLKNARKNLYGNLRRTFSNIREKIPGFSEGMLFQKIDNLDENEITSKSHSSRTLAEFIKENFGIAREFLLFRDRDFMKVFGTDALRNTSPDLYSRAEKAAIAYKNHGVSPSLSLIRDLIGFYGTADKDKKKEICEFFDVVISLPDAIKTGFISEADLESIAEQEFSHVWSTIDANTKKSLIQILKFDDNYNIELATFDAHAIDRHFDSKKMKDILTRAITNSLVKNEDTPKKMEGITKKLVPEIGDDGIPRIHNPFLQLIKSQIIQKNGTAKIQKIEKLTAWSVLIFTDEAEKTRYFRIDETDASIGEYDHGVIVSDITGRESNTIGSVKNQSSLNYDTFYEFLQRISSGRVVSIAELDSLKTTEKNDTNIWQDHISGTGKILDISATENVTTPEWFTREINLLDPDGEKIWLWAGIAFASKGVLENGDEYHGVWTISSLNPPNISISNRKHTESTTLDAFLEVAKTKTFRRIAKLETPEDFLHTLYDFWVDHHAHFHDENLVTKVHDHDSHGHEKEVEKNYEFFQSKSGGHIRINWFTDGLVSFGEYNSSKSLADIQKIGNAWKLSKKDKQWLYINQTVSYGEFIAYLKKNDMKATTDNLLVPNATDAYHPHDPHLEWSLLSKMGTWWSVADMIKGFSNLTHGIEHYFEKTSKLNASRFALSMGRKLGLPLDIMAQLQADEVGSVKEIIEKIQEKLRNLNGPVARKKALHIAHNKNARPEEVGAAILHMVKGYGHLYAEDIAYAQGSESFINWLLNACGFHGQALTDMKKKAREKSKVLLGNEAGSDLSEEEMIWGFMKMMDGNHDKYPVAATLVKAMGGPSGFENAWRKDGFDGAYEKWVRQAGDLVNGEARVDHGLSALSTHEFHTAIGSMEQAAGKNPDPSVQTLPVVWALGWYSQYLSTKWNQHIKKYADGKWHSLHAFAFLRSRVDNELFRYTFREALRNIAPHEVAKMDGWIHDLEYDGHTPSKMDKIKPAINGLAGIWRKYQDKGLHNNLQWKNMWLVENAAKDPMIKKYFEHLAGVHLYNSKANPPSDDNGWSDQFGYNSSPILNAVNTKYTNGYTLNSADRMLQKIKMDSHQLRMDKDEKVRYWDPLVKIVKNLDTSSQNEDMKKSQFFQYRRDILLRFNEAFSSKPQNAQEIKKQEFYGDLLDMGIDISVIFEPGWNPLKKIEKWADRDYIAWKNGGHQWGNVSNSEVLSVSDTVKSVISSRQDAGYQWVWRNIDLSRDPVINPDEAQWWVGWEHELWDGSGPD